ncbi:hypothetical protein ACFQ0M_00055 [Kitasatospora aburaviensis]
MPASVLIDVVVRSAVTVAVVGALGLLPLFTREIHDNRAELARMAVLEERCASPATCTTCSATACRWSA